MSVGARDVPADLSRASHVSSRISWHLRELQLERHERATQAKEYAATERSRPACQPYGVHRPKTFTTHTLVVEGHIVLHEHAHAVVNGDTAQAGVVYGAAPDQRLTRLQLVAEVVVDGVGREELQAKEGKLDPNEAAHRRQDRAKMENG